MPPKRKLAALDDDSSQANDTTVATTTTIITSTTSTSSSPTSNSSSTTSTSNNNSNNNNNNNNNDNNKNNNNNNDICPIPMTSDSKQIYWQYQNSEFEWKDIKYNLLESIEKIYQKNPKDSSEQTFDDLVIIFSEMKMHNSKDNAKIKKSIKRVFRQPIWSWEKGRGEFKAFKPDVSLKVESSFLKGLSKASINAERYINFSSFEQARFDDDTKTRRVRRNHIDVSDYHNPYWYFLHSITQTTTPKITTKSWKEFDDSHEDINKAYKNLIEKGDNTQFKISDDEIICFLTMTLIKKGSDNVPIKIDNGPVLPLKKSYSQLSEQEKKDLINKMLSGQANDSKKKKDDSDDESSKKKQKTENSGNYLPGELDVLKKDKPMKYILRPTRHLSGVSQADAHFRIAESQFYRLLTSGNSMKVTKVEYICNPTLTKKFNAKMEEFKAKKYEHSDPVFGFHGTAAKNIIPICTNNFSVPGGSSGVKHATDSGWYGKGIYFSEFTDYSIGYIKDCTKILLCKVLLGKAYKCSALIHGKPCATGYTSHLSPDEKELVIFHPDQILPVYIVHYQSGATAGTAVSGLNIASAAYGSSAFISEFNQAYAAPASNILNGFTISLLGTLSSVQYNIQNLITKHGGSFHSHSTNVTGCTQLVTTVSDYNNLGSKVQNATLNNVPIVNENWLYKTIIHNKLKKVTSFSFNGPPKSKSKTDVLKPIPLEQLEYDDDEDEDEDEDDSKKKKPPCKYGDKCYRKSAEHFKEFSHSFLID
ncbi:hypothetical protein RB653_001299 [Dictyostelium firmibasis]|uniref:Poly [ADP-ribose] polymerase n=1 Tax=Dictyostelium firmibasis TaxID=79012 RepID=A0AAN7UGG0_9MYCE